MRFVVIENTNGAPTSLVEEASTSGVALGKPSSVLGGVDVDAVPAALNPVGIVHGVTNDVHGHTGVGKAVEANEPVDPFLYPFLTAALIEAR